MKKYANSLPSTRADLFFTERSVSTLAKMRLNYQHEIINLVNCMQKMVTNRPNLKKRDFESIINKNKFLIIDIFGTDDLQEIWGIFVKDKFEDEIGEDGQISLFIKILLEFQRRKLAAADNGNNEAFEELDHIIKGLSQKIIDYYFFVRKYGEEKILSAGKIQKERKMEMYGNHQTTIKHDFQKIQYYKKGEVFDKMEEQSRRQDDYLNFKAKDCLKTFQPSLRLKETKNLSLLNKLAPYRWDKKRAYEGKTYRDHLNNSEEFEQERVIDRLEHFKRVQKEKLRKQHLTYLMGRDMRQQRSRSSFNKSLNMEKRTIEQKEINKNANEVEKFRRQTARKVVYLQKSIKSFMQYCDSSKIKEIIKGHTNLVQFNPNISEVIMPHVSVMQQCSKYSTIENNLSLQRYQKNRNRRQKRFEKSLMEKVKNGEQKGITRRESLVDMYDECLKVVK